MNRIYSQIKNHYTNQWPFVCYRKPFSDTIKGVFCKDSELAYTDKYDEEGFVFSPFDNRKKSIFFSTREALVLEEVYSNDLVISAKTNFKITHSDKVSHINLVNRGVENIKKGQLEKVVLSREEVLELDHSEIDTIFRKMLARYPNAFVYVWYHPEIGLWLGATPERLIVIEGDKFMTMALAGTQQEQKDVPIEWGNKEKREHQLVVDYIVSQIKNCEGIAEFKVSETYTVKAGSLLHLRADIEGKMNGVLPQKLIQILHPTPAVCGMPKEAAKEFILENESYDRSFYTGYLGEIEPDGNSEIFVNLRCAQLNKNEVIIYVGGGITSESNAEKEWLETLAKSETIKKVL